MTPEARSDQREKRTRPSVHGARFAAAQSLRVGWYAMHYVALRRMRRGDEDAAQIAYDAPPPDRAELRRALVKLFQDDFANIEAGLYPAPRDLDPRHAAKTIADSRRFFADSRKVNERRLRRDGVEVRTQAEQGRYPPYYVQNFHFQTDGWLSRESARLYDTQVEVLFTGAADAMRRAALAEIALELRGCDQRRVRLLDVACGAGRFLEQTLDAFPRLNATGLDLSGAYLAEAEARLSNWRRVELVEANAEAAPFDDGAFDIVSSIYLFHELPPKVRPIVAQEMARLCKPGGLIVFADSVQTGDDPNLDRMLEAFPHYFHEPYYRSYCGEDLDALFAAAGLIPERSRNAFLTKVRTYRKPQAS